MHRISRILTSITLWVTIFLMVLGLVIYLFNKSTLDIPNNNLVYSCAVLIALLPFIVFNLIVSRCLNKLDYNKGFWVVTFLMYILNIVTMPMGFFWILYLIYGGVSAILYINAVKARLLNEPTIGVKTILLIFIFHLTIDLLIFTFSRELNKIFQFKDNLSFVLIANLFTWQFIMAVILDILYFKKVNFNLTNN